MDEKLRSTFDAVCEKNGSRYCHMPSGAGHDAINMALVYADGDAVCAECCRYQPQSSRVYQT